MQIDDIEVGMTLWTVLTTDADDVPIVALIRGVVTAVHMDDEYPYFECAWKYGSQPMTWITFDEEEVYASPEEAMSAYVGWVIARLSKDLISLTKEDTENGLHMPAM